MKHGVTLSRTIVTVLICGTVLQLAAVSYIAYTFNMFGIGSHHASVVPGAENNAMKQVKEIIQHDSKILQKFKASQKKEEAKGAWSMLQHGVKSVQKSLKLPFHAKLPQESSFDVFLGILSKEGEEDKRAAIRSTFVSRFGKKDWKYLFFVAKPKGFLIQSEISKYKDIVVVDVDEKYREEPKVVMSMLKTALTAYPKKPKWIVKSDSSVYVNVADLLSTLRNGGKEYSKNYYGGSIVVGNTPIRDKNSIFYESKQDIPSNTFAPYNSQRGGYIFSSDLASCMVEKVGAKKVKLLHNQDVAMSIVALACGAKPKTFVNHLSIMFPDMVKKEQMKNQDKKSKELSDMIPYQWNKRAAKLVGQLRKNIPDQRASQCKTNFHDASHINLTSIIITFVEEQPTVFIRTLRTIVKNTPPKLLKEIILIDDGGSQEWLNQPYPTAEHPAYPEGGRAAKTQTTLLRYVKSISPKIIYARQERKALSVEQRDQNVYRCDFHRDGKPR